MVLNRLFHTSLRVGKQVRSETGIGDSSLSVPHVAVKLAEGVFGTLRGRRALVLGAGDMSELLIKHLMSRSVEEVRIANRTPERARRLAERVGGRAVSFDALSDELAGVDVVVSSTGAGDWVVRSETVAAALARREEPLVLHRHRGAARRGPCDPEPGAGLPLRHRRSAGRRRAQRRRPRRGCREGGGHDLPGRPRVHELAQLAARRPAHKGAQGRGGADPAPRALPRPEEDGPLSRGRGGRRADEPLPHEQAAARPDIRAEGARRGRTSLESAEVRRRLLALEGLEVELHRSRPS